MSKIAIVIVTYGERWKFLSQVLEAVIYDANICKIILVDNASINNLEIDYFVNRHFFKVQLIREEKNLGCAGGFTTGIKYTKILDCDYVLLLEDDNLPEKDFVEKYLNNFKSLNDNKVVVLGNKKSSQDNENIFYTQQDKNNFKLVTGFSYGGTFLPKQAVKDIPLPDPKLFSYGDDIEYGFNIIKSGYKIYESQSPIIKYLNEENQRPYKTEIFSKEASDFKIFLKTRNMVIIYLKNTQQSKLFSILNIFNKYISLCVYGFIKSGLNKFTIKRLFLLSLAIYRGLISDFDIPKYVEIPEGVILQDYNLP